jgi:hypothetical protein
MVAPLFAYAAAPHASMWRAKSPTPCVFDTTYTVGARAFGEHPFVCFLLSVFALASAKTENKTIKYHSAEGFDGI